MPPRWTRRVAWYPAKLPFLRVTVKFSLCLTLPSPLTLSIASILGTHLLPFVHGVEYYAPVSEISSRLTGQLPNSLANCSMLEQLDLTEFGRLANLSLLALGENQLVGPIPATFAKLNNLSYLLLNGNRLNGSLPPALGSAPSCSCWM
ncbi:hypothetical protein R1flu_010119 [Riccia fluitans]|uniref:Uncharacterized protein n=1 Tax=Riccia fluitans TaxID=41844 RepID=A0ABD1Z739_9MARC